MNKIRVFSILMFLFFALTSVYASPFEDALTQADELHEQDKHQQCLNVLNQAMTIAQGAKQQAEVFWRLSRVQLNIGDNMKDNGSAGDDLLLVFEEGQSYGQQAIDADPGNVNGYYWKASNIGRWGQTKGILDSLFKAGEMRDLLAQALERDPDHADSYYVLSQLYVAVPRMVSFGNTDYGVSLSRKAVSIMQQELRQGQRDEISFPYLVKLSEALIARDWSSRRRERGKMDKRNDYSVAQNHLEKGWFWEGQISIPNMSDKEEARQILVDIIRQMERIPDPGISTRRNLSEAKSLLDGIN